MKKLLVLATCAASISAQALPTYEPFTEYAANIATNTAGGQTNSIDLCTAGLVAPSGERWLNQSFSGTVGSGLVGLDIQVTNNSSSVFTYSALSSILPATFPGLPAPGNTITTTAINPAQPTISGAESPNIVGNSAVLQFAQDIVRPASGTKTLFVSYLFSVVQLGATGAGNIGRYLDFLASSNLVEGAGTTGFYKTWQPMYNTYGANNGPRYFGHGVLNPTPYCLEPQDSAAGKTVLPSYTVLPISFNTPYLVVGEFVFVSTNASLAGTKDTNIIWVNPSVSAFGGATPTGLTMNVDTMVETMNDVGGMVLLDRPGSGQAGGLGTNYIANLMLGSTWSYVTGGPEFTSQPPSTFASLGGGATISGAAATAAAQTVSYQWQRIYSGSTNNVNNGAGGTGGSATVSGATNASLTLSGIQAADYGTYQLVATASGTGFSLASAPVILGTDPEIAVEPQPAQVNYGNVATISVTILTTAPTLSYVWYDGSTPLSNGPQPDGSTALNAQGTISTSGVTNVITLTLSNVSYLDDGNYSVVVTNNDGGSVPSTAASLTVIDPYISVQPTPASQTVLTGNNATISVVAAGTDVTYQWYGQSQGELANNATFSGVTNATLTITDAQDAQADNYYVIVNGASGAQLQSSFSSMGIADTNAGPFASTDWPSSLVDGGATVHYCILDPNASFSTPANWLNSLVLAPNSGDQTYTAQVYLDGLYGDQVNNQSGFLNVADTSFSYWTNMPVIDVLIQVYGDSSIYTANPIAALEGEIAPANTLTSVNIGVPLGADNQVWNWMLIEVTNPIDGHGIRTVGDNSVTSSAGEYSGVNNGTIRFQNCNGWAVRAIAWGPQGVFGTSNQVNQFAAAASCPSQPNNNLAYIDVNKQLTNYLELINSPGAGYGYSTQSGVGPAGDLRSAVQSTGGLMNFGILSNYLGYPCNQPLNMELGIEFYDDPNLAGTVISPYQYATDEQGDLATYAGLTYTTLGTGKWLKLGFTIPTVDLEGVSTSPLTGGPTLEFSGLGPWIDRIELGVYETGTNALAGLTPDQAYQQDPLVGQTNYGYYAEWNPSSGIIDNLDTAGYAVSYAGPAGDQLICEVPEFISAGNNRIQFGLSNSVFGAYTQGNVDMVMTLTYYDDPALAGATIALSEYFTWNIDSVNPNNAVLPIAPYSAAAVLRGTGTWTNSTFELPNISLFGVYGSMTGDGVVIWAASTNVRVSAAQFNVIRPCGPFEGIDYLQTLAATTAETNMDLTWRGTAAIQATTNLIQPWANMTAITNTLTNTYSPSINPATRAEFFRLSVPPYPPYLGLSYTEGLIQNGAFLANAMAFTNSPGYLGSPNPSAITGWSSSTAGQGINGAGVDIASGSPFGPNGASQYTYAFIQNPGILSQNLALTPNTTYQLSFYAAARSTDNGVVFQVQIGDNSQVYVTSGNVNANNNGFTPYTYTFTTPGSFSGTPTIQLQNASASGSGVTVDFADVSLTP